jgi:hypothetical protein
MKQLTEIEQNDQAVAIAEDLLGTCKSLNDVANEHDTDIDRLTMRQFDMIDEITLECEQCNWWCEPGEFSNEDAQICDDCVGS